MPPELLAILQTGGIGLVPLLGYIYYLERKERISAQQKLEHMTERVIVAMTETKSSLEKFANLLVSPGRKS